MNLLVSIVCGVFVIVGTGITVSGIGNLKKAKQSQNWPQTQAIIIESKIITERSGRNNNTTYQPRIKYSYTVKQNSYQKKWV